MHEADYFDLEFLEMLVKLGFVDDPAPSLPSPIPYIVPLCPQTARNVERAAVSESLSSESEVAVRLFGPYSLINGGQARQHRLGRIRKCKSPRVSEGESGTLSEESLPVVWHPDDHLHLPRNALFNARVFQKPQGFTQMHGGVACLAVGTHSFDRSRTRPPGGLVRVKCVGRPKTARQATSSCVIGKAAENGLGSVPYCQSPRVAWANRTHSPRSKLSQILRRIPNCDSPRVSKGDSLTIARRDLALWDASQKTRALRESALAHARAFAIDRGLGRKRLARFVEWSL